MLMIPARISALYEQHRTAYLLAQPVGLVGVAVFVRWVVALRRHDGHPPSITVTGALVAVAAVATNVAVRVLCLDTGLSPTRVHDAALGTDVTDDVLFACFALLTVALAISRLPRWARYAALLAAAVCAVRAVRAWWRAGDAGRGAAARPGRHGGNRGLDLRGWPGPTAA